MSHKRFINFAIGAKEKYFKIHPDLRWILCSLCAYLLNNSALSSQIIHRFSQGQTQSCRYYTYNLLKPNIKSCISKLRREKNTNQ